MARPAVIKVRAELVELDEPLGRAVVAITIAGRTSLHVFAIDDLDLSKFDEPR